MVCYESKDFSSAYYFGYQYGVPRNVCVSRSRRAGRGVCWAGAIQSVKERKGSSRHVNRLQAQGFWYRSKERQSEHRVLKCFIHLGLHTYVVGTASETNFLAVHDTFAAPEITLQSKTFLYAITKVPLCARGGFIPIPLFRVLFESRILLCLSFVTKAMRS